MRDLSLDSTVLNVGDATQTFLDNAIIESVQDVTRRWHRPKRITSESLIRRDRPWEHTLYFTYSNHCVLWDEQERLFRCWYEDLEGPPKPTGGHFGFFSRQLYAQSSDGLEWEKPSLDIAKYDGMPTNIVLGGREYGQVHSASYVIDKHPRVPDERFRTIYTFIQDDGAVVRSECAHSPDGLHWQVYGEKPSCGSCGAKLGDVSVLFYDDDAHQFVQNTRHCAMGRRPFDSRLPRNRSFNPPHEPHHFDAYRQRRVFQSRSHDFIHWTELIAVAAADDYEDNLDESFYGMAQWRSGTIHLATVGVLHMVDNTMDVQLLMSRDGIRWQRTAKRQPFLSPRGAGSWDAYMVSLTSPPVPVGDELFFFHGGSGVHHDWWMTGIREGLDHPESNHPDRAVFGLGLAKLRKDGYASLAANELREGIICTRALAVQGQRLEINGRCAPGGYIRVELADSSNHIVGACSKALCDALEGDSVSHVASWSGSDAIPALKDKSPTDLKLRFYLKNAELFSFRFCDS